MEGQFLLFYVLKNLKIKMPSFFSCLVEMEMDISEFHGEKPAGLFSSYN